MKYTQSFYDSNKQTFFKKKVLFDIVFSELNSIFDIKSVIDIGTGSGTLIKYLLDLGYKDILGIDISTEHKNNLLCDEKYFEYVNLSKPYKSKKNYDLAVCLEVAEHISKSSEDILLKTITESAPLVLFSAAIPYQNGTHHVNEQYQSYWAAKFKKENYYCLDLFRKTIWNHTSIDFWFKQNLFLYVHEKKYQQYIEQLPKQDETFFDIIHPTLYEQNNPENMGVKKSLYFLYFNFIKLIKKKLT